MMQNQKPLSFCQRIRLCPFLWQNPTLCKPGSLENRLARNKEKPCPTLTPPVT